MAKNAPKDEKMIEQLKKAYTGELLVCTALIKDSGIKPFSDFRPQILDNFRKYFDEQEKQNLPPPLYVYPQDGHFIMSDDYNSYCLYKEKGYSEIMCIVLGEAEGTYIIEKSEPFQLPLPTVKEI